MSESRTLVSLVPSAFLPALVFEIANGAIAPIIVLTASDLGASPSTSAFMLAFLGVGRVLGDIPASWLADRLGDRHTMIVAAALALVAFLVCLLTQSLFVLGVALIAIGASDGAFYLARHSYLMVAVPVGLRARAMSTLAGAHRIGLFIGPLIAAAAISMSTSRSAYVIAMAAAVATIALLTFVRDIDSVGAHPISMQKPARSYRTLVDNHRLFATLGLAILAVGAARAARQVVLPLWGYQLGLSPETISIVFAIAGAVDMALFYPAGYVMDRYGRLAVAVPSMAILGASMMVLPLSTGLASLTAVAVVMSLGNGIGSGVMMTIGTDVAPFDNRLPFLGVWRLLADSGNAAGPVVVSLVATVWTLAAGITAVGSAGLLAALGLAIWTPRYSPYATIGSMRHNRPTR